MTNELLEEYDGADGRECTISIINTRLSMWKHTYEVLFAKNGKIIGRHVTDFLEHARLLAHKWIKEGELTHGTK